jgi:hypothetical protein
MAETGHSRPGRVPKRLESRHKDAVTSMCDEISSSEPVIVVHVPPEPPSLTPHAARILLDILVELTNVPVLDGPQGGAPDER